MMNVVKNIAKKLPLILLSALFGLAVCEAGLRLLGYRFTGSFFTTHPLLGWSFRPRASGWPSDEGGRWGGINRHGDLERGRTLTKTPGVFCVGVAVAC